jgi:hypothetical protein
MRAALGFFSSCWFSQQPAQPLASRAERLRRIMIMATITPTAPRGKKRNIDVLEDLVLLRTQR